MIISHILLWLIRVVFELSIKGSNLKGVDEDVFGSFWLVRLELVFSLLLARSSGNFDILKYNVLILPLKGVYHRANFTRFQPAVKLKVILYVLNKFFLFVCRFFCCPWFSFLAVEADRQVEVLRVFFEKLENFSVFRLA